LLSREVDATDDVAASKASIEAIWQLWRATPGTILIPGHDLTMRLDEHGTPHYIGQRVAVISAWFSETLEQTTEFDFGGQAP
jgi:N-acyl homoserine lactone hydrolase